MKNLRYVCLIAMLAAGQWMLAPSVLGQSTAAATGPQMQRGVSVRMAVANEAQPVPAADDQEAWIVAVSEDGSLYFGIDSVTGEGLKQQMISHPRTHEQKLYLKADARTKFSNVQTALQAARAAEFKTLVLLTAQVKTSSTPDRLSPEGLEVWLDAENEGSAAIVVGVADSGMGDPRLTINQIPTSWGELPGKLSHAVTKDGMVVVKADGDLAYSQVVKVVDACRRAGVRVILTTHSGR